MCEQQIPSPSPRVPPLPPSVVRALPPLAPSPRLGLCLRRVATPSFRHGLPSSLDIHLRRAVWVPVYRAERCRHRPKQSLSSPIVARHYQARRGCSQGGATSLQASEGRRRAVYKPVDPFCQLLVLPPDSPVHHHLVGCKGAEHHRSVDRASRRAHAGATGPC